MSCQNSGSNLDLIGMCVTETDGIIEERPIPRSQREGAREKTVDDGKCLKHL